MQTKGSDGKTSLLHYLVGTISAQAPELLNFPEELPTVKQVSTMRFYALEVPHFVGAHRIPISRNESLTAA